MKPTTPFTPRATAPAIPLPQLVEPQFAESALLTEGSCASTQPKMGPLQCTVALKEGCYDFRWEPTWEPGNQPITWHYRGTLRVEIVGRKFRISADLYRIWNPQEGEKAGSVADALRPAEHGAGLLGDRDGIPLPVGANTIPVYPRESYRYYYRASAIDLGNGPWNASQCQFSIWLEQFTFGPNSNHGGGTLGMNPARTVHLKLTNTPVPEYFEGQMLQGRQILGNVSLQYLTAHYREATVELYRVNDAALPGPVGPDSFERTFGKAGWKLRTKYVQEPVSLPDTIADASFETTCAAEDDNAFRANLHRLMESLPGYNAQHLDREWKVYCIALKGAETCDLFGAMFDHSDNDLNNLARQGCAVMSHTKYPDSERYCNSSGLPIFQSPKSFLRTAIHEVGHAFNLHHEDSRGNDIMIKTGEITSALQDQGLCFPDDLTLQFSGWSSMLLRHASDAWLRPGMKRFVRPGTPTPVQIERIDADDLGLQVSLPDELRIGEPVVASWTLTNHLDFAVGLPSHFSLAEGSIQAVITNALGQHRLLQPVQRIVTDDDHQLQTLQPGQSISGSLQLFYSHDGFCFETPGVHQVQLWLQWQRAGRTLAVVAETATWVRYPVVEADNFMAAQLLHDAVGTFIATNGHSANASEARKRINAVIDKYPKNAVSKALVAAVGSLL